MCYPVRGTTFSGHPTLTTMGNTWRSLCYYFYICYKSGLGKLWKENKNLARIRAAGDDVCIQCIDIFVDRLREAILKYTSREKNTD